MYPALLSFLLSNSLPFCHTFPLPPAAPTQPSPSASEVPFIPDAVFAKDAVPQFGVVNDFIHAGYRPPLGYRKCVMSAFAWNNETLNIWTHVVATLIFGVQMLRWSFSLSNYVLNKVMSVLRTISLCYPHARSADASSCCEKCWKLHVLFHCLTNITAMISLKHPIVL